MKSVCIPPEHHVPNRPGHAAQTGLHIPAAGCSPDQRDDFPTSPAPSRLLAGSRATVPGEAKCGCFLCRARGGGEVGEVVVCMCVCCVCFTVFHALFSVCTLPFFVGKCGGSMGKCSRR